MTDLLWEARCAVDFPSEPRKVMAWRSVGTRGMKSKRREQRETGFPSALIFIPSAPIEKNERTEGKDGRAGEE